MEAVYDALHEAPIVKEAQGSGKFSVVRRGVMKVLTSLGKPAADAKYVTLTFGTADDPAIEPMEESLVNVLTKMVR